MRRLSIILTAAMSILAMPVAAFAEAGGALGPTRSPALSHTAIDLLVLAAPALLLVIVVLAVQRARR